MFRKAVQTAYEAALKASVIRDDRTDSVVAQSSPNPIQIRSESPHSYLRVEDFLGVGEIDKHFGVRQDLCRSTRSESRACWTSTACRRGNSQRQPIQNGVPR